MKKRMYAALTVLLLIIASTVCYANEMASRISQPGYFDFYARSSTANQYLMSEPTARVEASSPNATITPSSCTGNYTAMTCWIQYCGLEAYSTGTKCTNNRNFQSTQFPIYYTSAIDSAGFFRFEGRSQKAIFEIHGGWNAG